MSFFCFSMVLEADKNQIKILQLADIVGFILFYFKISAEREGFEPPEPLSSTVFKTAAIDHSAISPSATKVEFFWLSQKSFNLKIYFLQKNDI